MSFRKTYPKMKIDLARWHGWIKNRDLISYVKKFEKEAFFLSYIFIYNYNCTIEMLSIGKCSLSERELHFIYYILLNTLIRLLIFKYEVIGKDLWQLVLIRTSMQSDMCILCNFCLSFSFFSFLIYTLSVYGKTRDNWHENVRWDT